MRKAGFAIFLISILLLPIVGSYLVFSIQQKNIQREIKRKIKNGASPDWIMTLRFSKADAQKLDWKHSKEFRYQNEMYDIVTEKQTKDSVIYQVIWDSKESCLFKDLDRMVSDFLGKSPQSKQDTKKWFEYSKNLFFETAALFSPHNSFSDITIKNPKNPLFFSQTEFYSIWRPPMILS
jgi:hypothetical protein